MHIRYDYLAKYYKICKLQGHNEKDCFIIHLELYLKKEESDDTKKGNSKKMQDNKDDDEEQKRIDKEKAWQEKEEGFKEQNKRGKNKRGNHHRRGRYEWNSIPTTKKKEIETENKFEALEEHNSSKINNKIEGTKANKTRTDDYI